MVGIYLCCGSKKILFYSIIPFRLGFPTRPKLVIAHWFKLYSK